MIKQFPATRKLFLLLSDIACIIVSAHAGIYIVTALAQGKLISLSPMLAKPFSAHLTSIPIMIILFGLLFNITNLFSLARKRFGEILLGIVINTFSLFVIMMALNFFFREFIYSRAVLIYTAILQILLLSMVNYLFWRLERNLLIPQTLLIIGSDEECMRIQAKIAIQAKDIFRTKHVCIDFKDNWHAKVAEVDTIALTNSLSLVQKEDILHYCHMRGKRTLIFPTVYEVFCQGMMLDKLDDIPVFNIHHLKPTLEQRSLKRIFDIIISLTSLIILSPIMLLVALAIYIDNPGRVLYTQRRVGRDEKEFTLFKFRSMRLNAEALSGPVLARENDPRITKVGNFIRRTRLDELPQLYNVLIGDMSVVGPRPERMFFVAKFKEDFPEYVYRHSVKPGITGMAQVYGKYNTTVYDKLIYDLMYIQQYHIFTDIVILIQTIRVLFVKSSTEGV